MKGRGRGKKEKEGVKNRLDEIREVRERDRGILEDHLPAPAMDSATLLKKVSLKK